MLIDYFSFLAKVLTVGIIVLFCCAFLLALIARARAGRAEEGGRIEIIPISEDLEELSDLFEKETLSKAARKTLVQARKADKKREKKEAKAQKKARKNNLKLVEEGSETLDASDASEESRLFVLRFEGDIEASTVDNLREAITAVLLTVSAQDEVLVVVDSEGGYVHRYGLAAAQLERIRLRNIPLTIAVDTVAASGGYLMACVGNRIIAAPFAIVGSIGVIAEVPNFHRVLEKYEVDYDQFTAGEFKSTVSRFAKNTDKGRAKFQEELDDTHTLFKMFIQRYRPHLAMEKIATGEHWHAVQAVRMGLVDELMTSDDYILQAHMQERPIFEVSYTITKPVLDRLFDRLYGYCAPLTQLFALFKHGKKPL